MPLTVTPEEDVMREEEYSEEDTKDVTATNVVSYKEIEKETT